MRVGSLSSDELRARMERKPWRLMSRKPVPAQAGDRARLEILFDKPQLLGRLFGEYDRNLIAIEQRLGVYISARGNRLVIEGEAGSAGRARDVLTGLYNR